MLQHDSLVGQTIGDYRILDKLGSGGMAVVYKAQHLRLGRYEALKILHPHLIRDQEMVQRFNQEARAVARLNHPNIATIYNVIQQSGYFFISMEYIEGRSLQEIISQEGKLTLERTLYILHQLAKALDYAHSRHLVHRDIKPANILIRTDDYAVLTDFGIAKALSGSGMTANLTKSGIVGTPAYMSPEHIRGEEVDYRTDLYSLGVVCYEMLSGISPFNNTTTASIIHAQLKTFPSPISQINPDLPRYVETAIRNMLAKRPEKRFPTAMAFVEALRGESDPVTPPDKTRIINNPKPSSPNNLPVAPSYLSPDQPPGDQKNKKIVWWAIGGGVAAMIFAIIVSGIIFLPKILGNNGPAVTESSAGSNSNTIDLIAFVSERDGNAEIYTMKPDGSNQINLTQSPSEDFWPRWAPDGSKIVFHSYEANDLGGNAEIYIMNADGKNWTRITRQESADKFPDWSPDGKRIVFASDRDGDYEIYTMSKDGTQIAQLTDNPARDYFPMWSPEGDRIIFESDRGGNKDLYYIDPAGNNLTQITEHPSRDTHGSWFFDRDEIIFTSDRSGQLEIWKVKTDATGLVQLTTQGGFQPRCSPDDTKILLVSNREGNKDIYLMNNDGSNLQRLTQAQERDTNPDWCCLK
jgi:serine/threonine-protein kinase